MKNPTAWFSPKTCCSKTILSFDSKGAEIPAARVSSPKAPGLNILQNPYENFLFNHIDLLYKNHTFEISPLFQLTNDLFSALDSGLTDPCRCTHPLTTSFIMASSPYEYEKTSDTTYNNKNRLI